MFTIIQAAGWPIWPLLICSVVALALVIERMMSLRPHLVAPEGLLEQALKASHDNLPSEEAMQQLHDHSVLGRILASGLHAMKDEPLISAEDLRSSMESVGREAAHELEKHLMALATIASAAPLLGLLCAGVRLERCLDGADCAQDLDGLQIDVAEHELGDAAGLDHPRRRQPDAAA